MKKALSVLMVMLIVITSFAACGEKTFTCSVSIVDAEGNPVVSGDVKVSENKATAEEAILGICQSNKVSYTYENGFFDNFGGIASTQTDGWLLYVDGKLSDFGAKETVVKEGTVIEFKYVNYNEAFGA